MKGTLKSTTSLLLIIAFLVACFFGVIIIFAASWLHTYRVFTQETPVAELTISELKEDDLGEYFDVTVRQVKGRSPLTSIFNPSDDSEDELGESQSYKLYGDLISIGGPTIKFKDFLTLFNFDLVYKIAFVSGEYSDPDLENNRTPDMLRRIDLNGGFQNWRSVQEDIDDNTLRGRIMKLFIDDLPQIQAPKIFVNTDREQTRVFCVTEESFRFCDQEIE